MFQGVMTAEHIVFSPDKVCDLPVARKRLAFVARLNHQITQNANKAGRSLNAWASEKARSQRSTLQSTINVTVNDQGSSQRLR
jgi:hypothetical protein